jgi:hypothetical protein
MRSYCVESALQSVYSATYTAVAPGMKEFEVKGVRGAIYLHNIHFVYDLLFIYL